jgi:S1-C subfamily serine protease
MRWLRMSGLVVSFAAIVLVAAALAPAVSGQAVVRSGQGAVAVQSQPGRVVVQAPAIRAQGTVRVLGDGAQLGVDVRDLDPKDKAEGAAIAGVTSGSPADKAGIKEGDVVVEFDGERVRSATQFQRLVRETPAGRTVKMAVMRSGKRTDLMVTPEAGTGTAFTFNTGELERELAPLRNLRPLDEQRMRELQDRMRELENRLRQQFDYNGRTFEYRVPAPQVPNAPNPPQAPRTPLAPSVPQAPRVLPGPFSSPRAQLGITVQELTPQLRDYFGTKEGVLVASVQDKGAADKAGLKAGDIITSIDGKPVRTQADLTRALADGPANREVSLGVVRDKKPMTIKAQVEAVGRRIPA